jgi:deazaflavin-dependent oxidoreductase (nitroreductase family)
LVRVDYERANRLQKTVRHFASGGPGAWLFRRIAHRIDKPVYRLSRGRFTLASLVSGLPVVMLTTTGARSGKRRSVPVVGLPTLDGLAVIASSYGQRQHPDWYYNLRANPEGEVTVDGGTRPFRAVEAEGDLRDRIWDRALEVHPGFAQYDRRAPHRRIGVFVLE